jgi:hypothetical protein
MALACRRQTEEMQIAIRPASTVVVAKKVRASFSPSRRALLKEGMKAVARIPDWNWYRRKDSNRNATRKASMSGDAPKYLAVSTCMTNPLTMLPRLRRLFVAMLLPTRMGLVS